MAQSKEDRRRQQREYWHRQKAENPERVKARRRADRMHAHRTAKYYVRKRVPQALVPWANEDKIKQIYRICSEISARTGIPHNVDHIVPLMSDEVCGFHCEANLHIVEELQNQKKGNIYFERDNNVDMLIFPKKETKSEIDPESSFDL